MSSSIYVFIAIFVSAVCTLAVRALPFLLLGGDKKIPDKVRYLGRILPSAIMAILIVYCLKGVPESMSWQGGCQVIAVLVCAVLHFWKKNALLSISVSTALYMILIGLH